MRIILFEIFGIQIKSYGLMIAIGIIVAAAIFINKGKKKGYDEDSLLNLVILAVIGGALGGKGLFILTEIKDIIKEPSILLNFGYGFVIYGAIGGGALAMYLYSRKKSWNIVEMLDMTVPGLAIAQGFGRVGCFLAGCCYGAETKLPIGVAFPKGSLAPTGIHVHPTQIYSSIFDFLLGFMLLYYSKKEKQKGKIVGLYLIVYSIGRFLVEFLRDDPRGNIGILSTSQFIAIFTLVIGIVVFNNHRIFKGAKKNSEK
ncbi:prolipoprotein diacylglyceryl transferase [Clostridium beijerinckii]|uniref:Phosphatidylglycerol--prolipoprotein diacylglyceryl transferase n=1 Tax=Clostridium beijerinckii TaxID=1520 RepID=A0AAX0B525_CLOBE|nr:prolipoprotein diacylglyceryl transferase [Clostridium beijerinckii]NRT90497.1 phosphatidylglycerol:prolipoprotein diacylglycerol transferase [Clostridium beijerinckii]NYC70022.1 phosphatidylglycerol:prolipoprotein diacylglycerol transferase [Clostridium beijerinckii]